MSSEGAPRRVHAGMVEALGLVLYVGAARDAATLEQMEALREQVIPYLRSPQYRVRGDEQPVLDMVHAIMGPDWIPDRTWRLQLNRLGRDETGKVIHRE